MRALFLRAISRPFTAAAMATAGAGAVSMAGSPFVPSMSMSLAAPRATSTAGSLRIVSYNVLSSSLCGPSHFVACDPADLDPAMRIERVKAALQPHMESGAVVCLQEVSMKWVGQLTPFFERAGYTFVSGNYGSPHSDYMGVSLAWPKERYVSERVEIARAADAKPWPDAPKPAASKRGALGRFASKLRSTWRAVRGVWFGPLPRPPIEPWAEAKKRHNMVVSARLRCAKSGRVFAVSTYHMPCLFGSDPKCQVMTIHAALAAKRALDFAEGAPCVLCGDFNIGPGTAPYNLLTTGSLHGAADAAGPHPHMPPPRPSDPWMPSVPTPFASAYAAAQGAEPDFTNLATTAWSAEPFVGTLDYIFLSPGWKATAVRPLPHRDEVMPTCKSYPTADEPSDHVAIWADLEFEE